MLVTGDFMNSMLRPGDLVKWKCPIRQKYGQGYRGYSIRTGVVIATGRNKNCIHGHVDIQGHIVSTKDVVKIVKKQLIPSKVVRNYL